MAVGFISRAGGGGGCFLLTGRTSDPDQRRIRQDSMMFSTVRLSFGFSPMNMNDHHALVNHVASAWLTLIISKA
jgi:hypothetical protein